MMNFTSIRTGARGMHTRFDKSYLSRVMTYYRTRTNRSGGIQGGISNGENIVLRVAFKPTSTIGREQNTVTRDGTSTSVC